MFKGSHEAYERDLVTRHVEKNDRILEIGAAIGFISLFCARKVGPENVLSFEANPDLENLIRKNFMLNGWVPNLKMEAISVDGRDVEFFVADNVYSSSLFDRSNDVIGRMVTVKSQPLDQAISRIGATAIVMDVEGYETDLLPASKLEGVKKLILETHSHITGQEALSNLHDHFMKLGFKKMEAAKKVEYWRRD